MENASKALIIAGAIIISILVIGLGVFIFSGASENADVSSSMNSQKAQAHNGTFTNYFGQRVSASKVKELMKQVATNNITAQTNDEKARIFVYYASSTSSGTVDAKDTDATKISTTEINSSVKSGYTYRVNAYNDNTSEEDAEDSTETNGYYPSGYLRTVIVLENKKG